MFEELPGEYLKRIESCKQLGVDFINKLMLHCEKSKDSTVHGMVILSLLFRFNIIDVFSEIKSDPTRPAG